MPDVSSESLNQKMSEASASSALFGSTAIRESMASLESEENMSQLLEHIDKGPWLRSYVFNLTQSNAFSSSILLVILLNTIFLALETVDSFNRSYCWYVALIDCACLGIYIAECILKLYSWRLFYFQNGWNLLDFFIVVMSVVTWILPYYYTSQISLNTEIFRVLRLFRTVRAVRSLRALRTINMLQSLNIIITIVFKSIPAMFNIAVLAGITLYMLAVIATAAYRDVDPRRFGTIANSMFRLFQLMTLDSWSNFVTDNRDKSSTIHYFVVFVIVLETFVFLNLFIAVIVNNLQTARKMLNQKKAKRMNRMVGAMESIDSFELELQKVQDGLRNGESRRTSESAAKSDELVKEGIVEELMGIENYYSAGLPQRTKEILASYFMHLTSLEFNMNLYEKQQKVLDELVDLGRE
ncbi:hypothetical protein BJ741DRAFT_619427 [Chytriomyces cf. hyalinus JEL632]|nr:hypothetical protein BJ741DRAFT_619427 [Chytriomyces cf. hyalinus JEL632]